MEINSFPLLQAKLVRKYWEWTFLYNIKGKEERKNEGRQEEETKEEGKKEGRKAGRKGERKEDPQV